LAARLRGPAEANWKVRSVLARHGWVGGKFRRTPDREQLMRDLARTARASGAGGRAGSAFAAAAAGAAAAAAAAAATQPAPRRDPRVQVVVANAASDSRPGPEPVQRCAGGPGVVAVQARGGAQVLTVGTACGVAMQRRRAKSWCGHRNAMSTRLGAGAGSAGGIGHATCGGMRRRGASRSP